MALRDLLDVARAAGARLEDELRRRAGAHLRVDGRRVFVSDAALHSSVGAIVRATAPELALSIESHPDGHLVRVVADGKPLSAVLVLRGVAVTGGRLRVEVETPRGIDLDARPVAGFFASAVARLLGGTAAARAVFSRATPDGLRWDGRRAVLEVPLAGVPLVGAHLSGVDLVATATRDAGGVWLEADRDGVAAEVAAAIFRSAVASASGKR